MVTAILGIFIWHLLGDWTLGCGAKQKGCGRNRSLACRAIDTLSRSLRSDAFCYCKHPKTNRREQKK